MKRKQLSKREIDRRFVQSWKWIDQKIPRKNASGTAKAFALVILSFLLVLVILATSHSVL